MALHALEDVQALGFRAVFHKRVKWGINNYVVVLEQKIHSVRGLDRLSEQQPDSIHNSRPGAGTRKGKDGCLAQERKGCCKECRVKLKKIKEKESVLVFVVAIVIVIIVEMTHVTTSFLFLCCFLLLSHVVSPYPSAI